MTHSTENGFRSKFRLLNSQETSEEIIWSCSDSSDYENSNHKENLSKVNKQTVNMKRKRVKTRKKTSKTVSNLDITFIDAPLEQVKEKCNEKPSNNSKTLSPVLTNFQLHFAPLNTNMMITGSPIISSHNNKCLINNNSLKSPILVLKHSSPRVSPNVRKKLFNNNNNIVKPSSKEIKRSKSPVFNCNQIDPKLTHKSGLFKTIPVINEYNTNSNRRITQKVTKKNCRTSVNRNEVKNMAFNSSTVKEIGNDEESNLNIDKDTNVGLIEKVKSYFESHFSSETTSQQSISEYDATPKNNSKTSEEIELVNSLPDIKTLPQNLTENRSSSDSFESKEFVIKKSKGIRYKKDGLAYRLNELLKKQKANISLWQHERFLAANSNFVLPKENFTVFRIQNVSFQYGCYLLEAVDIVDQRYIILINRLYMNNVFLEKDKVFKLYSPFRTLDFNSDCKLIVNVCKFECMNMSEK